MEIKSALITAFLAAGVSTCAAFTADEIVAKAMAAGELDAAGYDDYTCTLTAVAKNDEGKEMYRMSGTLYVKKPDKSYFDVNEYYEMGVKKDPPGGKTSKGTKKGNRDSLKSPFTKEYVGDYVFTDLGREPTAGRQCYKVGFEATKKTEGYCYGTAWIDATSFELLKAAGKPCKEPPNWAHTEMTMYFGDFGGRTMFRQIDMYTKATLLLTMKKDFYVSQTFSDYKFNQGLADGIFE